MTSSVCDWMLCRDVHTVTSILETQPRLIHCVVGGRTPLLAAVHYSREEVAVLAGRGESLTPRSWTSCSSNLTLT